MMLLLNELSSPLKDKPVTAVVDAIITMPIAVLVVIARLIIVILVAEVTTDVNRPARFKHKSEKKLVMERPLKLLPPPPLLLKQELFPARIKGTIVRWAATGTMLTALFVVVVR